MIEIKTLRKLPLLEVNERLTGKALLSFEYDGQTVEIDLLPRYARFLFVLKMAYDEDLRSGVNERRRGYRSHRLINRALTRLPGDWNLTEDSEVVGKAYGLRSTLNNTLLAHDLKPRGRNYFIESANGLGYRLGEGFVELTIKGFPSDPESEDR